MALNHRPSEPKAPVLPPPLPPRRTVDASPSPEDLRKIYEDGEIRRFLHVFSSYVSEVKALDTPPTPVSNGVPWLEREGNDEESLSKFIADNWVEPNLPASRQVVPAFTLGKARLTTQRLYLAFQTFYTPFLQSCYDLARWKDYKRSLAYCSLYWILWWHNMVLPCLILWPVIISFRRRLQPYPIAQQLKEYQEQIALADSFSDRVSDTLASPSSALDIRELWRLAKLANNTRKLRLASSKVKSALSPNTLSPSASTISLEDPTSPTPSDAPAAEEQKVEQELQDLQTIGLYYITAIADLHERIHNIFVWRNPAISFRYIMGLIGVCCFITFVPTRLIAKAFWLAVGSIYWHLIPVLDALSPDACSRIPSLLSDVPTDADYAMQLISQRVAAGQDILPPTPQHKIHFHHRSEEVKTPKPFIPKSLGEIGKLMTQEAGRITKAAMDVREGRPVSSGVHPLVSNALAIVIPEANPDVYTYMCQFGSTPGLITLTLKRLFVTPMFSGSSKEEIPVDDISGVKKIGLLKGLRISWQKTEEGHSKEEEFKFSWVANRDDLFARLVGLGKQRWKSV
ncbi:hypothetical protein BKA70DRAFT_1487177 [Coprinopsis sp. MPI-PUGE-AT-0042]|nr:hypothetical protein BKA70DRAFT_1487177 [Coprinopsis sp. MPI-PUGE-AT-0042]